VAPSKIPVPPCAVHVALLTPPGQVLLVVRNSVPLLVEMLTAL
jgi:hypothetical protein